VAVICGQGIELYDDCPWISEYMVMIRILNRFEEKKTKTPSLRIVLFISSFQVGFRSVDSDFPRLNLRSQ
jgi:hypothetical protein